MTHCEPSCCQKHTTYTTNNAALTTTTDHMVALTWTLSALTLFNFIYACLSKKYVYLLLMENGFVQRLNIYAPDIKSLMRFGWGRISILKGISTQHGLWIRVYLDGFCPLVILCDMIVSLWIGSLPNGWDGALHHVTIHRVQRRKTSSTKWNATLHLISAEQYPPYIIQLLCSLRSTPAIAGLVNLKQQYGKLVLGYKEDDPLDLTEKWFIVGLRGDQWAIASDKHLTGRLQRSPLRSSMPP